MSIQLSIGPRVRKSPFFESARRDGMASASVYNHMVLPISYGDPHAEYDALINRVAMWDVAVERQVALKGPDAVRLATYLTGRNLANLEIGQGKYSPLCNFSGILINDPVLQRIEKDELWFSIADTDIGLWASAIAGVLGLDVEISEPDVSPLALQGPLAEKVMVDLFGIWVSKLKSFEFLHTTLENIPLIVARSGWSKQGGFELYLCDSRFGDLLWAIVKEAGKPYGIAFGAPNGIERLESGLISVGADTDAVSNPFEFGLDRFIDLEQTTDFIGKMPLLKIRSEGIVRRFVGLVIDPPKLFGFNENKVTAYQGSREVGYLSAAAFSPTLGKNIGVGVIWNEAIINGLPIEFAMDHQTYSAQIRSFPWEGRLA